MASIRLSIVLGESLSQHGVQSPLVPFRLFPTPSLRQNLSTLPVDTREGDRALCLSSIFGIRVGGLLSEKSNLIRPMDQLVAGFVSRMGLALPVAILLAIRAGAPSPQ